MGLDFCWETESGEPATIDSRDARELQGGLSDGAGIYFPGTGIYKEYIAMIRGERDANPYQDMLTNDEVRQAAQTLETALVVVDVDESYYCDFEGYSDEDKAEFDMLVRLVRVFNAHADAGHVLRLSY